MAERILHPSYSLQVPKGWMIRAVSMKGELVELVTAANAHKRRRPVRLVDAGTSSLGKSCAIDWTSPRPKSTYSSFGNPDLKSLMARAGRIVITGVVSECCVLATAIDAIDTGTPVVYLTDACSGSTQEYEDMATAMMEFASPTHTAVMTCEEYTALRQG